MNLVSWPFDKFANWWLKPEKDGADRHRPVKRGILAAMLALTVTIMMTIGLDAWLFKFSDVSATDRQTIMLMLAFLYPTLVVSIFTAAYAEATFRAVVEQQEGGCKCKVEAD